MSHSRLAPSPSGTTLSRRDAFRAVLAAVGAAGVAANELVRPRVASPQDVCAEGSEVTELTYLGRREDGRHLVRARWRLRELPEDLWRCNSGTRLHAIFTARYVGGELRSVTVDLTRDPSRQSAVAALPAVGQADLAVVRVEVEAVTGVRCTARRVERV
jgi:hypothetical protein